MEAADEREVLEHSLEEHRRELRVAVAELKEAATSLGDPRDPIREHPARWLVAGLLVGMWFGWRPSA